MEYEMETDYQPDYIAQSEPNQEEYQQIQYLYNMLYQVSTLHRYVRARRRVNSTFLIQMMPQFEDQENMDDEEMELVLNAIEYIKGLNHTKIKYHKKFPSSANFCEWANSRADVYHLV